MKKIMVAALLCLSLSAMAEGDYTTKWFQLVSTKVSILESVKKENDTKEAIRKLDGIVTEMKDFAKLVNLEPKELYAKMSEDKSYKAKAEDLKKRMRNAIFGMTKEQHKIMRPALQKLAKIMPR